MRDKDKIILILNADKINRDFINQTFKNEYKLVELFSSDEAINYIKINEKDIASVICDLSNSFDDSFGFLVNRKANRSLQLVPVVAIVKKDDTITIGAVKSQNVTYIVTSPLIGKDLARAVYSISLRYELDEERILSKYGKEIENAKTNLEDTLNSLDVGAYILELKNDSSINLIFNNRKADELFGHMSEEVSFFDNISNDDQLKYIETINNAKNNYDRHYVDITYGINNDNPKKVIISIKKIFNYINDDIKFVCTVLDKTEQAIIEHKANQSEILLDALLDNSGIGTLQISITERGANLIGYNQEFKNMVGYDDINLHLLYHIIPRSSARKMDNLAQMIFLNAKNNLNEVFTYNSKLIRSDFTYIYVECKTKIYYFDGIEARVLVIINDRTNDYKNNLKIENLVKYDRITNTFRNNYFTKVCDDMIQKFDEKEFTLISFEISNLTAIQSVFGKKVVDELLEILGKGLKECAKKSVKGKIDNQTFAICGLKDNINPENFKNELNDYIKDNFDKTQVSLYFAVYNIDDPYVSVDTLILRTNYVLNEIRGSALKHLAYCDNKLRIRAILKDEIRSEMEDALINEEFEIYLQPVYDINTKTIVSAEALSRWHHPKKGYISPSEYIPVFEESGFVVRLDNYVWNHVCMLIKSWMIEGKKIVPISVNVSRIDLFNINFYDRITTLVKQYNIPPKYLRLEITESAYVTDSNSIISIVNRLREFGFTVLMDDFGSGYSSLNSLKNISVDILKIDMDLVRGMEENPKSLCILKSVIELGCALDLQMICEGIETEKQASFVKECGCKNAQGWLYSKAIPVVEFEEKLVVDGAK